MTQLVINRRNLLRSSADVGVPGSKQSQVPQLAAPGRIHRPRGFLATTEFTGQGSTFVGPVRVPRPAWRPGPVLRAGQPPADLSARQAQGKPLGAIPCDGAVHQITTQLRLLPHGNRAVVGVNTGRHDGLPSR